MCFLERSDELICAGNNMQARDDLFVARTKTNAEIGMIGTIRSLLGKNGAAAPQLSCAQITNNAYYYVNELLTWPRQYSSSIVYSASSSLWKNVKRILRAR